MVNCPERNPTDSTALLCIDEKVLAAAIREVSIAHRAGGDLSCDASPTPKNGRTFFLSILLELILPGISPHQVLQLLQLFVISPTLQHLHKADTPRAQHSK
jgi:hypothetical protein